MRKLHLATLALGFIVLAALRFGQAEAAIRVKTVDYKQGGATLEGWLVFDDAVAGKRPGVVVFPGWSGPTQDEKNAAERLAKLGYVALVADVFGKGIRPNNTKDELAEASKYMKDRALLRARAVAALDTLGKERMVDKTKLAAIGYCFGGAGALDLARSGAPLRAVVTFHGDLSPPPPEDDENIKARVLVLHGADDPLVNAQAVQTFEKEMTADHVDWQVVLYSGTLHAFTNPGAHDPAHGSAYNARSAKRSWQAMTDFFKETL